MNKMVIGVLVLLIGALMAGSYVFMDMQGDNTDDQSSVDQPESTDGQTSNNSGSTTSEDENVERPDEDESPPPPPEN